MNNDYFSIKTQQGKIRVNVHHGKYEMQENIKVARYFAEKYGHEIDLLPRINNRKTADVFNRTLGIEQEYKVNNTPTINAIDRALRDGKSQATHIILWIESNIDEKILRQTIASRILRSKDLQSVTIVKDGNDVVYTRKDLEAPK